MAQSPPLRPNEAVYEYMPPKHVEAFKRAAAYFSVWILVRRGNKHSREWIGQIGYIPKPLDCKAKTADRDFEKWKCAGLVVSPKLVPMAFSLEKYEEAEKEWCDFERHLYSFDPKNLRANLTADREGKHYTLQLDKTSKHYGCVMYKPVYRAAAEYLHSDYDLYAIVPVADPKTNVLVQETGMGGAQHSRSPNFYPVQYFVKAAGELKGAANPRVPMICHGEQETFKTDYKDPLDVFWPDGKTVSALEKGEPIKEFYRNTLGGRRQVSKDVVFQKVYGNWVRT
ncbi:MAG TPA: hypothetical protein VL991_14885 [Terracidiphilus sp.]|nr:hypothetical protein [Terracidiphilus sp.]